MVSPMLGNQGLNYGFVGLYHILEKVLDAQYLPAYRMVKYQSSRMGPNGKTLVFCLGLWCLSPEVIFSDVKRLTKSIILTSGTLSPVLSPLILVDGWSC